MPRFLVDTDANTVLVEFRKDWRAVGQLDVKDVKKLADLTDNTFLMLTGSLDAKETLDEESASG